MLPDSPRLLSSLALARRPKKCHVRCFQKYVRYFTKLSKTLVICSLRASTSTSPFVNGHPLYLGPGHIEFCVQLYLTAGAAVLSTITSLNTREYVGCFVVFLPRLKIPDGLFKLCKNRIGRDFKTTFTHATRVPLAAKFIILRSRYCGYAGYKVERDLALLTKERYYLFMCKCFFILRSQITIQR